jgi:hypothetical protein
LTLADITSIEVSIHGAMHRLRLQKLLRPGWVED